MAPGIQKSPQVFAFTSRKGGTGKTTLAVLSACRLKKAFGDDKRVILVDCDVVGTGVLGIPGAVPCEDPASELSLYQLLMKESLGEVGKLVKPGEGGYGSIGGVAVLPTFPKLDFGIDSRKRKAFEDFTAVETPYLRFRLAEVIKTLLKDNNFHAVVLDLPAFDQGFARLIQDLLGEKKLEFERQRNRDAEYGKKSAVTRLVLVSSTDFRDLSDCTDVSISCGAAALVINRWPKTDLDKSDPAVAFHYIATGLSSRGEDEDEDKRKKREAYFFWYRRCERKLTENRAAGILSMTLEEDPGLVALTQVRPATEVLMTLTRDGKRFRKIAEVHSSTLDSILCLGDQEDQG